MAPEQARGEISRLGPRTDVYALGAILYYMLAGRPPYDGGPPREILARVAREGPPPVRQADPTVPRPLASVCARAMAREPEDRYASARQLADDVDRYLDGLPVSAHRESLLEAAGRLLDRYKVFVWLIAAYLALRVLIFAFARR
jgi:serine/threonine-protein kinase